MFKLYVNLFKIRLPAFELDIYFPCRLKIIVSLVYLSYIYKSVIMIVFINSILIRVMEYIATCNKLVLYTKLNITFPNKEK